MTGPQRELLDQAVTSERNGWGPVRLSGPMVRVGERLSEAGLVELRIGGSGVAWQAPWWMEIVPTDQGRIASGAC